jgi:hypothetical protein
MKPKVFLKAHALWTLSAVTIAENSENSHFYGDDSGDSAFLDAHPDSLPRLSIHDWP